MNDFNMDNPQLLKNYYDGVQWLEKRHFIMISGRFRKEYAICNDTIMCVSFTYYNNTHCIEKARGKWAAIVHYKIRNKTGELRKSIGNRNTYSPEYHKVSFCETPKDALSQAMMMNSDIFKETNDIVNEIVNS